jgi:hypothetical protein
VGRIKRVREDLRSNSSSSDGLSTGFCFGSTPYPDRGIRFSSFIVVIAVGLTRPWSRLPREEETRSGRRRYPAQTRHASFPLARCGRASEASPGKDQRNAFGAAVDPASSSSASPAGRIVRAEGMENVWRALNPTARGGCGQSHGRSSDTVRVRQCPHAIPTREPNGVPRCVRGRTTRSGVLSAPACASIAYLI